MTAEFNGGRFDGLRINTSQNVDNDLVLYAGCWGEVFFLPFEGSVGDGVRYQRCVVDDSKKSPIVFAAT